MTDKNRTFISRHNIGLLHIGDLISTATGEIFYTFDSPRFDSLIAFPMKVFEKPLICSDNKVIFHLNPITKGAYPERRHDEIFLVTEDEAKEQLRINQQSEEQSAWHQNGFTDGPS